MTASSAPIPPTSQVSTDSIISAPPLDWSSEDFFAEPARLECLNILYHLGPYTSDPLVVLGECGSGRTSLLAQLSAESEDNWRLVTVTGAPALRMREFCGQVAQAFGLTLAVEDDSAAWIAGMLAHYRHLLRAGQHPVLLVDDADLLPSEVLALLRELAREIKRNGDFVGLIFTALPGFTESAVLHDLRDLGAHIFDLPPLDELTARKFIGHQLRRHGLPPSTVDERALVAILRRARGSMAQLAAQVERLVPAETKLDSGAAAPVPSSDEHEIPAAVQAPAPPKPGITMIPGKRRPLGRWLAGGALGSALAAALIFQDRINELISAPPQNIPAEQTRLELPLESPPSSRLTMQESTSPPAAVSIDTAPSVGEMASDPKLSSAPVAAGTLDSSLDIAPAVQPDLPRTVASQDNTATTPLLAAEGSQSVESPDSTPPVVESMLLAEVEELAPEVPESAIQAAELSPTSSATGPLAAKQDQPVIESPNSPVVAPAVVPATSPPTSAPAASSVPAKPKPAQASAIHGDSWYLKQSAEDFTVQIMALRSDEDLRKIGGRVKNGEPLAIYEFRRESGPMFALTYGRFSSREAALQASKQLPKAFGKVQPWVRKFKIIQQEIRQAQSP